jgi:hypothetical protein
MTIGPETGYETWLGIFPIIALAPALFSYHFVNSYCRPNEGGVEIEISTPKP